MLIRLICLIIFLNKSFKSNNGRGRGGGGERGGGGRGATITNNTYNICMTQFW